jgi:predicted nucleotidyltransferase component of viral defense system
MNLFERLVAEAMQSEEALGTVQAAVEKELLHHDILREMGSNGLLAGLTFIGGTCLRACYGSPRLSEDLDFTGGTAFVPDRMAQLGSTLERTLAQKYGLPVSVSEPAREDGNVSTWKVRVETFPTNKHLPSQRIHIDICALNSYQRRPAFLRNDYGVDMGTAGLVVQVQSREEILADKWVALAFRPNRIQYRDVWDILWLERQGMQPSMDLLSRKLTDRRHETPEFLDNLSQRITALADDRAHPRAFRQEMERFLAGTSLREPLESPEYWSLVVLTLQEQFNRIVQGISAIG